MNVCNACERYLDINLSHVRKIANTPTTCSSLLKGRMLTIQAGCIELAALIMRVSKLVLLLAIQPLKVCSFAISLLFLRSCYVLNKLDAKISGPQQIYQTSHTIVRLFLGLCFTATFGAILSPKLNTSIHQSLKLVSPEVPPLLPPLLPTPLNSSSNLEPHLESDSQLIRNTPSNSEELLKELNDSCDMSDHPQVDQQPYTSDIPPTCIETSRRQIIEDQEMKEKKSTSEIIVEERNEKIDQEQDISLISFPPVIDNEDELEKPLEKIPENPPEMPGQQELQEPEDQQPFDQRFSSPSPQESQLEAQPEILTTLTISPNPLPEDPSSTLDHSTQEPNTPTTTTQTPESIKEALEPVMEFFSSSFSSLNSRVNDFFGNEIPKSISPNKNPLNRCNKPVSSPESSPFTPIKKKPNPNSTSQQNSKHSKQLNKSRKTNIAPESPQGTELKTFSPDPAQSEESLKDLLVNTWNGLFN